jgi:hypothetical protein
VVAAGVLVVEVRHIGHSTAVDLNIETSLHKNNPSLLKSQLSSSTGGTARMQSSGE